MSGNKMPKFFKTSLQGVVKYNPLWELGTPMQYFTLGKVVIPV